MLVSSFTLLLFVQVGCDWVQISQQHYKKPLRPTHNHPLLATGSKTSEPTRLTHSNPSSATVGKTSEPSRPTAEHTVSPVVKVIDVERTTKRNRIYINHTLPDHSWDTGIVEFNDKHDFANRKPPLIDEIIVHETKSKGDISVIRRPKPDEIEISAITNKPLGHRTPIAGNVMRVHPMNNKESQTAPKLLEEYKGPIEVLNMADLEYTTAEATFDIKLNKDIKDNNKHKQVIQSSTTPKEIDRRKKEPTKTNDKKNQARPHDTSSKQPLILKGVTNMRRVEILRSTKPTPIEEFDDHETEKVSTSPKTELVIKERTKNRDTSTTPYIFPNIGNVKRVHIIANTTRATRKPKPHTRYTTPESVNEEDNSSEQSEKIANNIRRIDKPIRKGTTEKTFIVETKPGKLRNYNQTKHIPSPEDVMLEELITEDEKQFDIKVHKVASIGTIKRVSHPTKTPEGNKDKSNRHEHDSADQFATSTLDEDLIVEDEYSDHNFNDNNFATSTEDIPILTTAKPKVKKNASTRRPEINQQIERYGLNPYKPVKSSEQPKFDTMEDNFKHDAEFTTTTESKRKTNRNNIKTESTNQHTTKRKENQFKNNTAQDTKSQRHRNENADERDENEEPLSSDKKNNAMENLIKFLKTVTQIIARNTRRGVHGKLRYLENLRDTLMVNIEERIEAAFPDDPPSSGAPGSRWARSAEPRGHVEFPSSEGALMTISFLTFAVFLIKLVLQVIQAYKYKTMMPTVVAAVGRAYKERRTNN